MNREILPPEKIVNFDPVEFFMSMSICNEKAKAGPVRTQRELRESGYNDSGMYNFGVAAAERYGDDKVKLFSFLIRWKAWSMYLLSGELERLHPVCEKDLLARCSIEAAADCPLTKDGELDRGIYLKAVADKL